MRTILHSAGALACALSLALAGCTTDADGLPTLSAAEQARLDRVAEIGATLAANAKTIAAETYKTVCADEPAAWATFQIASDAGAVPARYEAAASTAHATISAACASAPSNIVATARTVSLAYLAFKDARRSAKVS